MASVFFTGLELVHQRTTFAPYWRFASQTSVAAHRPVVLPVDAAGGRRAELAAVRIRQQRVDLCRDVGSVTR